jgi:hypothetical protein
MRPRLGSRGWTFTDVACRLKTSCQRRVPVIRWWCSPQRVGLGAIWSSAGFRRHRRDLHGMAVMIWLPHSVECAVAGILQARGVL